MTEKEAIRQANKELIVVGATFEDKGYRTAENYKFTIDRITPKRVYLNYTISYKDWNWKWNGNRCEGKQIGIRTEYRSAYIEYDTLLNVLNNKSYDEGLTFHIQDYIKGDNYISIHFEETEFIPEGEEK